MTAIFLSLSLSLLLTPYFSLSHTHTQTDNTISPCLSIPPLQFVAFENRDSFLLVCHCFCSRAEKSLLRKLLIFLFFNFGVWSRREPVVPLWLLPKPSVVSFKSLCCCWCFECVDVCKKQIFEVWMKLVQKTTFLSCEQERHYILDQWYRNKHGK